MAGVLKGNYKLPEKEKKDGQTDEQTKPQATQLEEEFEAEALKRLGGSITFVRKSKSFTWRKEKRGKEREDV